jgi:hypothetical protein
MRFKAKKDLIHKDLNNNGWYLIKKDNIYKGEYSPKMYDPNTFQTVINLIITCEDGKSRKFDTDNFYSLEEWREIQLDSILD